MTTANYLPDVLETTEAERLATGFLFTEGPLWHPDGWWHFVDLRRNQLLRLVPGGSPEAVRTTIGGNGTTFDLEGRLIVCEGDDRRLTRMGSRRQGRDAGRQTTRAGGSTGRTT
jgi:gluconolactonase